jgi:glutamyl-tRNA reductase
LEEFKTIAITHKGTEIKDIGKLHVSDDQIEARLAHLKAETGVDELLYISTCNRVEFITLTNASLSDEFVHKFFQAFNPEWSTEEVNWAVGQARLYQGERALQHFFYVASSVDSLVVGEREIITQVRQAYEQCSRFNLTGDKLRLLVRSTIETAKRIYTETQIAQNPVSVVSLAYRKLREVDLDPKPRIVMIGAGQTNQTMGQYLKKAPYGELTVYNRTAKKAVELAKMLDGKGHGLDTIANHDSGLDILITCTGSDSTIVDKDLFEQLTKSDSGKKVVVDLAIPSDVDRSALNGNVTYIGISDLKDEARKNLELRQKELEKCKQIIVESITEFEHLLRERDVELAMKDVPNQVKKIKEKALNEVFAKDLANLDEESKEVLEKVIQYMEKKYISGPMKLAKEIMKKG